MEFALGYAVRRFVFRFTDFFHHWYVDASRRFLGSFFSLFKTLDETLAIKITLRYFFHPLYGDYTVMGRILGVVFRSGRVALGFVVYVILAVLFLAVYGAWLLFPVALLYYAFSG